MTIVLNQPMQDYRQAQALASSDLKLMITQTPFHFANRDRVRHESASLTFGTLAHLAILEPEEFSKQVIIEPSMDRRTKAYKEWRTSLEDFKGLICSEEQMDTIAAIQMRLKDVGLWPLLQRGQSEASVYTSHEGHDLKCRPDKLDVSQKLIVDFKTSRDLRWFAKDAISYGYDFSVAHYKHCLSLETGTDFADWSYVFVAVETDVPFDCDWFVLSQEKTDAAVDKWNKAFNLYKSCVEAAKWHGYAGEEPREI